MATAVVIQSDDDQYIKYRHGRFESTQAVAIAKGVLPEAGYYLATMYGVFSEHFTHMGGAYRGLLIATPEVNDDDVARLRGVLFFLKGTYLMIDLVSERAFFDFQTEPHYWKRQESGQLMSLAE